jgi:tetratricopeptide (TPR) repeat protein
MIPNRLTTDFTGRDKELADLVDWLDDTESRACMLYGDGGIGKTTLAVEFIHRILDGSLHSKFKPELITFYTAKKTRWGLNGLEVIKTAEVGVADVATHLARSLDGKPLDRSWYAKNPDELVQKLSSFLIDDWGVTRNSHLLILDNTETMASNSEEVKELARQVRELSRRVGRVLLTSRRREAIEAHQIEIKPLSDDESLKFLRARASALNRRAILDAGSRTLTKYAKALGNKPLVLEVFVGALGEHGIGLENAFQRVQRMHSQDLGEFLYADAWQRMTDGMRHLFLLMTRVSEISDDTLLKLCCGVAKLSVVEAYEALEESRGIAQVSRFEDDTQILFSSEFVKFCGSRSFEIDGQQVPSDIAVEKIKNRYNEFLRSRSAHVWDRIDKAYRHALARVAFTAYREGRDDDCAAFFELAVAEDVDNGWLYDRYAVFLSTKFPKRRSEALDWAKMAVQLIPKDPDAWYTRGTIESKLGKASDAIDSLQRSAALGKPRHLVAMQQAAAYMRMTPPDHSNARAKLSEAESNEPKVDPLLWKYHAEVRNIRRSIEQQTPRG